MGHGIFDDRRLQERGESNETGHYALSGRPELVASHLVRKRNQSFVGNHLLRLFYCCDGKGEGLVHSDVSGTTAHTAKTCLPM